MASRMLTEYPCGICGKVHDSNDTQLYAFYRNELYCLEHPGVREWFDGLLKILDQKLERLAPNE